MAFSDLPYPSFFSRLSICSSRRTSGLEFGGTPLGGVQRALGPAGIAAGPPSLIGDPASLSPVAPARGCRLARGSGTDRRQID